PILLTAVMFAVILPTLFLFLKEILDTKLKGIPDIRKRTTIPFIGTIGNNIHPDDQLVVLGRPKSSISESFRALRSNLQFLYRKKDKGNKTILITSSIGGEGKTFIAMNLSTILALSGKRTILIGMDMRKPKIFGDFDLNNKIGLSNYLSGAVSKEEILQNTQIEMLDIITSGPIPPNPSELLLTEDLGNLITELESVYDYIVIDTPPVALVSDAYDLMKFADATLYVTRFDYTYRGLLKNISDK